MDRVMNMVFADVIVNPLDVLIVSRKSKSSAEMVVRCPSADKSDNGCVVIGISPAAATALIKYFKDEQAKANK